MRFLTGDELGNIKSLCYSTAEATTENKFSVKTVHDGTASGKSKSIQRLSIGSSSTGTKLVAAAHADGSASLFSLGQEDQLASLQQWRETRFKPDQKYVGLAVSPSGIYSCSSNGVLRLTSVGQNDHGSPASQLTSLPMRLCDWRLSSNEKTFAYGGEEVELSVWDTELAFAARSEMAPADATKRKRGDVLLPGELWRAKNVSNDFLGLRQPVHITSLTYLSPSPSLSQHHLLTGTRLGDVRRYDTRAARRPVADWKGVGKLGGIKVVEKGFAEHEVFVADHGCNIFAIDLRNGRTVYGYKGISGAATSIAPAPSFLASTALDRYSRIHTTFPPPLQAGQQQGRKGEVLEKVFMKSIPTAVIWDQEQDSFMASDVISQENDEEGDIWEGMENVGDDSDEETWGTDAVEHRSKKNKKIRPS